MKLASLFSGGKDSVYAAYLAKKEGHDIKCLINLRSENPDSYMFHTINDTITEKQAEVMNLPLLIAHTKGEKEKELDDLERVMKEAIDNHEIEGVTVGAVESEYQAKRVKNICDKLGIKLVAPFWKADPEKTLRDMINNNFEIIIVKTAAEGLDKNWIGREIDNEAVNELVKLNKKYFTHIMGEGGEYDTIVTMCPLFNKKIEITKSEKIWNEKEKVGQFLIKEVNI